MNPVTVITYGDIDTSESSLAEATRYRAIALHHSAQWRVCSFRATWITEGVRMDQEVWDRGDGIAVDEAKRALLHVRAVSRPQRWADYLQMLRVQFKRTAA
jgi:hypothetical protein